MLKILPCGPLADVAVEKYDDGLILASFKAICFVSRSVSTILFDALK